MSKVHAAHPLTQVETGRFGPRIMQMADHLATLSEDPAGLTCTFLSEAHLAVRHQLQDWMQQAGLTTTIDAVGNVIGKRASKVFGARSLLIGSHYDTVRNAGKYDGRLGILVGLMTAEYLGAADIALPFDLEVIAFSEEEGVRFSTPYIGSAPLAFKFERVWLKREDDNGLRLGTAMQQAGLRVNDIPLLARRSADLLGYLEVHIEQGPVLLGENLPVGIVTAIAGAARFTIALTGTAGHAGTVPMGARHDAIAAAAEFVLFVERRCAQTPHLVGTVGQIAVPNGAINVVPGRCEVSLDVRAKDDATRDAALADIFAELERIAQRRGVSIARRMLSQTPAVACAERLQQALADSTAAAGIQPFGLVSGAGHDAVMLNAVTDVGMLFVRCGNGGISHSPDEIIGVDDADVAARVCLDAILRLAQAHDPSANS